MPNYLLKMTSVIITGESNEDNRLSNSIGEAVIY